ncbi:hypothetical protein BdFV1_gp2 [Botryosphaeria dothidea fusarivirus 1]|uniref:Uncharacterized protein n=1 Tax=Botryosphaeria dothidea fusarivirus 1 TaxID=2698667 RepID=A0AAE6VIL7_9VIRU|nr:hypothetical protein QKR99_gp2 [Botryosphaeria dothidea fusarivirus 1]QHI00152.1 hypothetical protein BdFV1_gp2 [Botryosphaeria dothidea fusarivirus 1]
MRPYGSKHLVLAMSTSNEYGSLEAIESALEVVHQNAISYKGKRGYFVDMDSLLKMERFLDKLPEQDGDDKVKLMRKDLESLKEQNKEMADETKRLRDFLAQAKEDARGFQLQFDAAVSERNAVQLEKKAEKAKILAEMETIRQSRDSLEHQLKEGSAKFDPEEALNIQEKASELRKELKTLNSHLEVNNAEINMLNAEVSDIKSKLDSAKAQRDQYKSQLDSLTQSRISAANMLHEKVSLPRPAVGKLTARVLGNKGLTWLHKAEEAMWNDYRERVYCLMLATKNGSTQNVRSLSSLLEIVFHWIKQQTRKVQNKIRSWVDLVEKDLREMKLKSIKFYRQKLEELNVQLEKQRAEKEKYGTWEREQEHWYETIYFYGLVFRNRIRRKSKSVINSIGTFFSSIFSKIGFWSRHRTFNKGKEKERAEEIFDYEKEALLIEKEKSHVKDGGEGPPPPPPPSMPIPQRKKTGEMAKKLEKLMGRK